MAGQNLKQDRHQEVYVDFARLLGNDVPALRLDPRGASFRRTPPRPHARSWLEENHPRSAARMLGLKTPSLTDKDGRHPALVLAEVYIHRRRKPPPTLPEAESGGRPSSAKAGRWQAPRLDPAEAFDFPAAQSVLLPSPTAKLKSSLKGRPPPGGSSLPAKPNGAPQPTPAGIQFHLRSPSRLSEANTELRSRSPQTPAISEAPSSSPWKTQHTPTAQKASTEAADQSSSFSRRMPRTGSFHSGSWRPAITMQQFLKVKGIFDDVDPDGKGKVALRDLLEFSSNNRIPNKVFARMTLGNDGTITLEEMVRCFYPQVSIKDIRQALEYFLPQIHVDWREKINAESAREIAEVFRLYDAEGRGGLSLRELGEQLRPNECLTHDALVELFDGLEMDPDAPVRLQEFEALLRDYYIQEQHSEDRHPTLDFLTHQKRVTSVWAQYFPCMPEPDALLRPSSMLPVLAPTTHRSDSGLSH